MFFAEGQSNRFFHKKNKKSRLYCVCPDENWGLFYKRVALALFVTTNLPKPKKAHSVGTIKRRF